MIYNEFFFIVTPHTNMYKIHMLPSKEYSFASYLMYATLILSLFDCAYLSPTYSVTLFCGVQSRWRVLVSANYLTWQQCHFARMRVFISSCAGKYTPNSHNCAEQGLYELYSRSEIRKIIRAFRQRVTRFSFQQEL